MDRLLEGEVCKIIKEFESKINFQDNLDKKEELFPAVEVIKKNIKKILEEKESVNTEINKNWKKKRDTSDLQYKLIEDAHKVEVRQNLKKDELDMIKRQIILEKEINEEQSQNGWKIANKVWAKNFKKEMFNLEY